MVRHTSHVRKRIGRRKKIGRRSKSKKYSSLPQGSVEKAFEEFNFTNQESYESDEYFRGCLVSLGDLVGETNEWETHEGETHKEKNIEGSDYADEYYIILDRVYEDFTHPTVSEANYQSLKNGCISNLQAHREFCCLTTSSMLQYIQCYESTNYPVVKMCVTIDKDFCVNVSVHGKPVNKSHELWRLIPRICFTVIHVMAALNVILAYHVCPGNPDEQFQGFVPARSYLDSTDGDRAGYREITVVSTVRSSNCKLLVKNPRCKCCCLYRRTLAKALSRQRKRVASPERDWVNCKMGNDKMSSSQKNEKMKQLRAYTSSLKNENAKLQKQLKKHVTKYGVKLSERDSLEMNRLMTESDETIRTVFPNQNSQIQSPL